MASLGQVDVSRRCQKLELIVFKGEQEVTVPVSLAVPASTQYLLQPVLEFVSPLEAELEKERLRVKGSIAGYICSVDESEVVRPLSVPTIDFLASFAVPEEVDKADIQVEAAVEAVEVDRGESDAADITAIVRVQVLAKRTEDVEYITASENLKPFGAERVKLQHVVAERKVEELVQVALPVQEKEVLVTETRVVGLSWRLRGRAVVVEGTVFTRAHCLNSEGNLEVLQGNREFGIELEMPGEEEPGDCKVTCKPAFTGLVLDLGMVEVRLQVVAVAYKEMLVDMVTKIGDMDYRSHTLSLCNRLGENEFMLNLDGTCQIPIDGARIEQVVPRIRILEAKALEEKVLIRGMLSLYSYYTGESGQRRVLLKEEEFNRFLALPASESAYQVKVWAWPETASCHQKNFSVTVFIRVELADAFTITPITDIHQVNPDKLVSDASVIIYVAAGGDTVFDIARKFNVTQSIIREYNGMSADAQPLPGEKLMIPLYQLKHKNLV